VLAVTTVSMISAQIGLGIPARYFGLAGWLLAIALAYWQRAPLVLGFGILAAGGWWMAVATSGAGHIPLEYTSLGVALVASASWLLGRVHDVEDRTKRFGFVFWLAGLAVMTVLLFVISAVGPGSDILWAETASRLTADAWIGLGLFAAILAGAVFAAVRRSTAFKSEIAVVAAIPVLCVLPLLAPQAAPEVWALLFSAVLLGGLVGLAYLGYARREDWVVTLSAVLLFIFVLVKYFDWVFTFMDRSLAFIVAGLLFIGFGFAMERARRKLLEAMEESVAHD
jgi:hypothetical protein